MMKKKILSVLLVSALTLTMLAGCGNTDTKEISKGTTENAVAKNVTSEEVEECRDFMRFLEIGEETTPIDEEILNSECTIEAGVIKPIFLLEIPDSVDVFNSNGFYIGYTKENITVGVVAQNGNWTWVNSQDGGLFIKTAALENAKVIEVVAETEETETMEDTEEVIFAADAKAADEAMKSDFAITELNQIMYAKQTVNTRSGPDTSYEKVGSLSTNQAVTVVGQADTGWYRILCNGTEMFVSDAYLSDTEVEIAAETSTSQETASNSEESPAINTTPEVSVEEPTQETSSALPDIGTATNDIVAAIRNGYGCITIPEMYPQEVDYIGGMSWFEGRVATATYWNDVYGIASNYDGCTSYWIEYSYTDGNDIVFRCYWG